MTLDNTVSQFEDMMHDSVLFRFRTAPKSHQEILLRHHLVNRFDIKKFLAQYRKSSAYPQDRLDKLAHKLMDIKLQMYLIELDAGGDNDFMARMDVEQDTKQKEAHIAFVRLSSNQDLILKSRVL